MPASGATIAGLGVVSAIGQDLASFRSALKQTQTGVKQSTSNLFPSPLVGIAAELDGFSFEKALDQLEDLAPDIMARAKRCARRAPRSTQSALIAALQAWQQAYAAGVTLESTNVGLVVAADHSARRYDYEQFLNYQREPLYLSPRFAQHGMDADVLGIISHSLSIEGEGLLASGASASGNVALIQGLRLIESGHANACLVVGVMADYCPMDLQAFHSLGVLGAQQWQGDPSHACRPFDVQHNGLIYGQASAAILLVSSKLACSPGGPRVRSGTTRLHASASTDPDMIAESAVMHACITAAGIQPEQIDYINTHGTASVLGDETEVQAIRHTFGSHADKIWLNATKALTGHCIYSAGLLEAVACTVQIQDGFLHGNPNLKDKIAPDLRWVGPQSQSQTIRYSLNNSFGFGGINSCVLIDDGQEDPDDL